MIVSPADGDDFSTDPHHRLAGKEVIDEQARRQVRTFLDELKNGTQNYRTVASLGGQVAQEYRGRAILELLQNAHDVLAFADTDDPRRISFTLRLSPNPELLIANSGRPFLHEDFSGICQLAQSPKDPNESVGNKGLGFQSVLELSTRPEVWSTAPPGGDIAFAFGFDPDVCKPIARVARALVNGDPPTDEAFGKQPVVDWSPEQTDEYRQRLSRDGIDPTEEVTKYLSPYVVPRFLGDPPPEVAELLEDGHVTVIRLPLDGGKTGDPDEATESVREQLKALDEAAMVFLHHLSVLRIDIDDEVVELKREVDSERSDPGSGTRKERLLVSRATPDTTDPTERVFHVWSRIVGGEDQPEEMKQISTAVRHLPNRWPEVRRVEVAVAVEEAREARNGVFVIFLPTRRKTGVSAHINAPFYGSLDRRQINFDDNYNGLLLEFVADLILNAIIELVNGDPEPWRGRAAIDLLAQTAGSATADQAESLTDRLRKRARDQGRPLDQLGLVLCDDGWHRPEGARTMPAIPANSSITRTAWRKCAGFTVVSSELDERRDAVRRLLLSFKVCPDPTKEEWADTLGRVADHVGQGQVDADWNQFLRSVLAVLPSKLKSEPRQSDADPLTNASFLPTEDGRLLSGSDDVQIFFRPRRGVDDAADFVGSVPDALKKRIAFLHPEVRTLEGQPQRNTEAQKFLDGRFVQSFRREDLLRNVVIPSLPELPVAHDSPEAKVCAETLAWTLKMIGEEEQESLKQLLAHLPVACFAGWFAMREAVFGPGWDGRGGDDLKTLADALPGEEGDKLIRCALLPADDPQWGIDMTNRGELFARGGVVEGLRLQTHDPIRFRMSGSSPKLPAQAPSTLPQSAWDNWRKAVQKQIKPAYSGEFEYELKDVQAIPVLLRRNLGDNARSALSNLVLSSLPHWDEGWEEVTIRKREGWHWSHPIASPLKHRLSTLPWVYDGASTNNKPLRKRWFVPESLIRGQRGRFRHLAPLSLPLAHRLAENGELLRALKRLGLSVYPTEDDLTGPDLLRALATVAMAGGPMPAGGFDVLLGQVRHAWRHFDPDQELPGQFVVRTRPRTFVVRTADELKDVYLPDHDARTRSLREHEQATFAMLRREASGRIGDLLQKRGARRASGLEESCLIDDRADAPASDGALTLQDANLNWLPVILLTLAAHGGANPRGPATDAWRQAAAKLHRVRVRHCLTIAVELLDAGRIVARSDPDAHWLSQDSILLVNWDVPRSGSYERIATACQAILDRQDLLKDLRLVLGSLTGIKRPDRTQVEKALERAEIDREAVSDIRLRWHGQTSMLLARIRPVVRLLGVSDGGLETAATDAVRLSKWLSDEIREWCSEELLAAARESYDDFEMGFRARQVLGEDAELPKWNEALRALGGEYVPVKNDRAMDQAKRHLEGAVRSLRAFALHVAVTDADVHTEEGQAKLFSEINGVHERFEMDAEWSDRWWEVPFGAVLDGLRAGYEHIPAVKPYLDVFEGVESIDEFNSVLGQKEVILETDPLAVARRNWRRLNGVVRSLWELYEAWLIMEEADRPVPKVPDITLDASMYLREWSKEDVLKQAKDTIDDQVFLAAVTDCKTIAEMRKTIGPTPRRPKGPKDAHKTITIAGKDHHIGGTETYSALWGRLQGLPAPTQSGPGPRPPPPEAIGPTPRSGGEANRRGGKTSHLYGSPHLPELVGIVGEMHAFRFLQSKFDVEEHAWVSEFRTKVLPLREGETDETSDSHGYDFRFTHDGKTWCVEVKATTEDGTSFDLTSGEIAAASRIAPRQDERWRILRVRRALSEQPECDWLPNPFDPVAGHLLRLRQGSMTVEYSLSQDVEDDR